MPPDEKETIDGLLTSLEMWLQGDEACQLVVKAKSLLEKRKAEVGRFEHEKGKDAEHQLKSEINDLNEQLFSCSARFAELSPENGASSEEKKQHAGRKREVACF